LFGIRLKLPDRYLVIVPSIYGKLSETTFGLFCCPLISKTTCRSYPPPKVVQQMFNIIRKKFKPSMLHEPIICTEINTGLTEIK